MTDQKLPASSDQPESSHLTITGAAHPVIPPRRIVIQSAILMLVMALLCGGMGIYILSDKSLQSAYSFAATAAEINRTYLGQVDWNEVFHNGVTGMTSILDRYSSYLSDDQFHRLDEEFVGEYVGIGVSVVRDAEGLLVMSVREHGPAAEAGVLTGDVVTKIGTTTLRGFDPDRSIELLRGKDGTSVHVTLFRPSTNDTVGVDITRRKLELVHVAFAGYTPDTVAYIRVLDFEGTTADDIKDAVDSLIVKPAHKPYGLILDLRGNPGGLFREAYRTADLFLNSGQLIVGTESRSRWKTEEIHADGDDITKGLPMAVLVDRGSASAAEIVSGALQKNKRAVLVGDTTFGKGLVQGFTRFSGGDGMRLTISRYYLAGNTYLNQVDSIVHDSGTGLSPDNYFAFIERKPFPLALERSLLLQKFAHAHEAEILAVDSLLTVNHNIAEQFATFAHDSGFVFRSDPTTAAALIADISRLDEAGPAASTIAANLLAIARQRDAGLFTTYADYIESRLTQIALEHRYGIYQSYSRSIVRTRPDIRYAARLLKSHQ